MTRREAERLTHQEDTLRGLGISREDAEALRRISRRLQHWYERECGDERGCVDRDDTSGKAYWLNSQSGRRTSVRDLERGAERRLAAIMKRYPTLSTYLQTDPRGAALYLLRPGDVPKEAEVQSYYSRGICVY